MESPVLLEDFGQKVDLTRRIREVLLNYPEGTTVLKELIQNADDAGATTVRLCIDKRVHGCESLLSKNLEQWQGPALLAYNDAEFSEEDFVSISRVGGSSKHGQAWKTGRFGVGFNSVYHLTDLPSFVSGKYVVLFDPQGVYLPNVSSANPGKRIEYVSSSAMSIYKDQFLPYCAFGCNMKTSFPGTLFRFPLRNADQGIRSKLSRQAYLEGDICLMFEQLYKEGVFSLLFLKSVLSIDMYEWDAGKSEPRKLFSCSVSSANNDTIWHRQALLRFSNSSGFTESGMDAYSVDFLSEAKIGSQLRKIDTFYVVQKMASASSRIGSFATAASKEHDIHLLPWASVAACIFNELSDDHDLKIGRAFCFLPLPVKTGLAIQVNGYFEVSSNRRGIWYGADMDRSGKIRSIWNKLLLEDVVAPAFTELLLGVQHLLGPTSLYYSLWPSGSFEEPWGLLVEHIYRSLSNAPVLYSDFQGGKWIAPVEAFLHDDEFIKSKELGEALLLLGMPIVHLPNMLLDTYLKYAPGFQPKVVTPHVVRHFLKGCKVLMSASKCYKLTLLEYCLDDLIDDDVAAHTSDLPLLPLANGDFGSLSEASKEISYIICDELEYSLLQQISNRVIDQNIPKNLNSRLLAVAKCSNANLIAFNIQYLLELFTVFVPADWKYKSKVIWEPESCHGHPSSSWFLLFWQYLCRDCKKLSLFCDWPILPSIDGLLYRASKDSKLINAEKLSGRMRDILVKIRCKILSPTYIAEHPDLFHYVSDADCLGVLESIDSVSSNEITVQTVLCDLGAEERDELRKFLLDPKWYLGDELDESYIKNCKRLPIYRVHGEEYDPGFKYSDLEDPPKFLPPTDVPLHFLGDQFISISSSSEEEILGRYHGIQRMGKALFYRKHALHRLKDLQPAVRDSIMVSVLQILPQLCLEDPSFRECLKQLEFVPTVSGAVKRAAVLYDPRYEELCDLLEDSDSFPSGIFEESGVLDMLQGLGLRTSVSPETIIERARQIEGIMHEDQQKAHSRGKVLLSYLEVNASKWIPNQSHDDQGTMNKMFSRAATTFRPRKLKSDLDNFWNDLRLICWCPVLVSAPFQALPWPLVSSTVAPPKLVRLQADMWLISASMRVLDGECSSTALSYNLGWLSPPGGSAIAAQLLELGKNNEIINDQLLRTELALAMPKIYSIMTSLVGSDEMEIVKAVLEGSRWIWVGDGFATVDEVILDGTLHLAPYIRVVPVDLAVFKELFLGLGVRESLNPNDYASILSRMAMRKHSSVLNTQELRAAIMVAQHLAEFQFHEQQVKIYLPDVQGRLLLASDLIYNDAPWLLGSDDTNTSLDAAPTVAINVKRSAQKFVHGNLSNEVAEKLGVCSLRRMLLAESADSMNMSLSGSAEAFGQHEALTTRLKHILEMYADGPGILFEMVQNAEDAGASEVIFLLDKTQYGTSSLLSPEMADWQGPALYCFNDSVFTSQDLYAISRIGQESKLEKPLAIGRFGLGFNCVYHFTDIPAFVSGDNVVIFDPHACNLPGISPSHPGLRIKYAGRKILEQFPDQFSPFLHFGCDLRNPYPGTLFRFPLRSASAALRSQIKREEYKPEDVLSLFESFSSAASDALLFLRNVKTISVYVKEGSGVDMQLLHSLHRNCISEPAMGSSSIPLSFDLIRANQHHGMDKDQFLRKLCKSIDTDYLHKCQKIVVTEKNLSGVVSHCWITSECIDNGQVKKSSEVTCDKSHKSVPWACVAAYIHSVNVGPGMEDAAISSLFQIPSDPIQSRKKFEGRAFCFLPLPISTGFPVHVNAYFELSSNRRDIWFGNDMAGGGKKRSEWNTYLLEDVVAPAYGHLLEKIASQIGPCDLFFSLWPTEIRLEPWASLVRKLYIFIIGSGLNVLHTKAKGGKWISTKQAIFPDFTFHRAQELAEALCDAGLPLVSVSVALVERFMEMSPSLHFLNPRLLRTLLIRRKREFKEKKANILALEYCLLDLRIPVQLDGLYGLQLLPLADDSFTSFEKNGAGERIYITLGEDYDLLRYSIPHQLVDHDIPEQVYRTLCNVAKSEESNISVLSCHLLEKLFLKLLPSDWQFAKKVFWSPGHPGEPSVEWIRLLWRYLKSCCDDLTVFSKWPILPVGDNYLLQLIENSFVIKDDGWTENISSLLLKAGCLFLRTDLPIEHPQLSKFVQPPTATGILNALLAVAGEPENIGRLLSSVSDGELHELRSFILQSKWFVEEQICCTHIEIIKHLPMFETYGTRKLVGLLKPIKWLKPDGILENLLDENFIRTESEREKSILKSYLGIAEPSKLEFYKSYVLNRMPEFILEQSSFSAIFQDVKHLIEEDNSIKSALSVAPFVLAANGLWTQPSRLYDPRNSDLQKFLHKEAYFPSEKFSDPETLDTLVLLGLKRTLDFTGFLDCAKSVSMLHECQDPEAHSYGKRLLIYLDALAVKLSVRGGENNIDELQNTISCQTNGFENVDPLEIGKPFETDDLNIDLLVGNLSMDIPEEDFWSGMKTIAWCPVCSIPPFQGLPWLRSTNQIASPASVRPKCQIWMVSSSMHILDDECKSHYLQCKLGWTDRPKIDVLCTQLIEMSKSYNQLKLYSSEELDSKLEKGILSLYGKLQEYIGTNDFMMLKAALNGVPWVWMGDGFVSPSVLAFDSPVKYAPYLYVVPSELSEFRELLIQLDVKLSFDTWDYLNILQRLRADMKGSPLSTDQLSFVHCVLVAVADTSTSNLFPEASKTSFLIPDSSGFLVSANDVVYNDAPWVENNALVGKHILHPVISSDLACRLGVKSLSCLSLVDEDMMKDLPCMDIERINKLLALYGNNDFMLFDLLELADCCDAKKLHMIFDKRAHPRQSLLQHNLGEFQGPALVAILEGVILTREEVSGLQLHPPWRLRGDTLNSGLGLLSCYYMSDFISIISGGYFYMFDPCGSTLGVSSNHTPAGKMFSLSGTNLIERFSDQFNPMLIGQSMCGSLVDSTIIRMPLSPECLKDGLDLGVKQVKKIFEKFIEHGSKTLIYLKSLFQVSFSTWEEGHTDPCEDYSVFLDSSSACLRNPFSEKKWRKFQLSRIFGSSNAALKFHAIDVNIFHGVTKVVDRWLVVLCLGSGKTRNMALDRRYLAYNLTPVAGVAAHISRDGHPVEANATGSVMAPLPLSSGVTLQVSILGCFLVQHNRGRYLFKFQDKEDLGVAWPDAKDQLIEAWNTELLSCVRDSYIEMMVEMLKLKSGSSSSTIELRASQQISSSMKAYGDQLYSFWPRSIEPPIFPHAEAGDLASSVRKADWKCLVEQVIRPFYIRVADLPVWQLFSGNLAKAEEGMFLSQPRNGVGVNVLPSTVCSFVKEHYPVFSVPWELVAEIQAVGVTVREIKPKMVRELLRVSPKPLVMRSVDVYIDVLEYCLSDIQLSALSHYDGTDASLSSSSLNPDMQGVRVLSSQGTTSSGDALEMVSSLGKALFDFGRGFVEDIGRAGVPLSESIGFRGSSSRDIDPKHRALAAELKGLPCPTATNQLGLLGITELWFANKEQQALMMPLATKFINPKVLDRSTLANIFSEQVLQSLLKLQSFSLHLLASNMSSLFHISWVNHVMESNMAPWFSWDNKSAFGCEAGPSPEWIRLFWKCFGQSTEGLVLFSDWPLIPAFLGRPILCRVRDRRLVFIPPPIIDIVSESSQNLVSSSYTSESLSPQSYISALEAAKNRYPWLLSLLNQYNIPIFDNDFMDYAAQCDCLPKPGQSFGQVIASKLVAANHAGYFSELASFSASDRDELLTLFAHDFVSNRSNYKAEELQILHSLPIYKTVIGSYTQLRSQEHCMISLGSFLKPNDELCLSYSVESIEGSLVRALGVPELHDEQILVKFALPGFEGKCQSEQEDVLIYVYTKWNDLQENSSVVEALKETKFVKNADEFSSDLCKPSDMLDPVDAILASVFAGERKKFPGERFSTDGWLSILRKLGLQTATKAEVILECARRVEFLGSECMKLDAEFDDLAIDFTDSSNEVSVEIWALGMSVLETIFSHLAVLHSNSFFNAVGKIAFIPAELGLPGVGGKNGRKRVLTSYSEAILLKDWPLAWSCAPIISQKNAVPPEYVWKEFYLQSPPAFPIVLKHLQGVGRNGGEETLAHWPTASGMMTVDEASCEVLKYMDKVWGSLSSSDVTELQKVAFLPAANGTRLVTASSLFARLTINLSPFAFELPTLYLPFIKILKDLGLQDTLSILSAKKILVNLQRACGYQHLNPNELRAVMEILFFICDCSAEGDSPEGFIWMSDAIVPDDGCRLVHAISCVYIDSYGSQFAKYIDTSRLRFVHPNIPERVCTCLGIKKLSDVVIEELDQQEELCTLETIGSVALSVIREKLLSDSFQDALWTLLSSTPNYIPTVKSLDLESMQTALQTVAEKMQFVKCLHSRFKLLPNYVDITKVTKGSLIPEWKDLSRHRSLYFVNREKTRVLVAEPPNYISVHDIIAIILSRILGSLTPLPIGSLFSCPIGSESNIVDILGLCSDKLETESLTSNLLGKGIIPQDALQVQFHPLRPFYRGEMVAWRYQNGEKLKYGRVVEDVRPSAGQALYRSKVETTLGIIEPLLSAQIFSFRSVIMGNDASTSTAPASDRMLVDEQTPNNVPETSRKGKLKSSQGGKKLQYGQVTPTELVHAVREMLSAAGINLDMEKQSLLQKAITLQEQLRESQATVMLEQKKSDAAIKEADAAKQAWVCRVCLSNEVDMSIVPCGHVLCRRCSSAVSKCPFCRVHVTKTLKIFRP